MTAAVDSTALLDILRPDNPFLERARSALNKARAEGPIVISEPAYAEVASILADKSELDAFLRDLRVRLVRSSGAVLHRAGLTWREYTKRRPPGLACSRCGTRQDPLCESCGEALRSRQHIVGDFIIGAHAELLGSGRLITRDEGHYTTYFPDLVLL